MSLFFNILKIKLISVHTSVCTKVHTVLERVKEKLHYVLSCDTSSGDFAFIKS